MQPLRIALAQLAPRLGELEANLARHGELLDEARAAGAGLVVFPELGLTGYQLQDLAADVAMRLDDPRLTSLARRTRGLSAIVSFVEESGDHRLFIAAALLEDGEIRHVHRKVFLPTYGLFDERRFFAPGDQLRAVSSRLGVGVGLAVCEDFWHLATPQVLAIDGAQVLVNVSSSPGRDLASTNEVGLGTASSWRTLLRTYAQLTTSFVVFCNRVGVDESVSFWGGSEVIAPNGAAVFSAPLFDEGLFYADIDLADVRRERISLPLLRDERPELVAREWRRLIAERAGLQHDFGGPGRRPGRVRRRRGAGRGGGRPMTDAALFVLPDELAIDTGVARRVIAEFIRGQLRQAGFERAVLGLSGGIDSALVAYLVAEAIGPERLLTRADAVPDVVAGLAGRCGGGRPAPRLRVGAGGHLGDGRRLLRRRRRAGRGRARGAGGVAAAARQPDGPDADERPVRPLGRLARARRRDGQQDRVADRLHDAVRGLGLRVQPDRRPVQEPGPPAGGRHRGPRGDHPQGAVGRPVARADRRDGGRLHVPRARPAAVLADRQAALGRRDGRLGFDREAVERVDRMVAGAEFKRQVPPIAKLGPRTAGVDYLYPRRRPGSARP